MIEGKGVLLLGEKEFALLEGFSYFSRSSFYLENEKES
jgi:hypothetical protein